MSSNGEAALVERLRADLYELVAVDVVALPDATLRSELVKLLAAANQLNAAIAARLASFDTRGLADDDACKSTSVWLRCYGRYSDGASSRMVKQARLLRDLPAVAEAAGRGDVTAEHVDRIAGLVKKVGVAAVRPADQILADAASKVTVAELGGLCHRIRDYVDPDGPEPMELFDQREFTLSQRDGMVAIRGQLDPEGGAAVLEALDALMRPPGPDDQRTPGQRRADALVELARGALAQGNLPTVGGMRPQVGILINAETLLYGQAGNDPRTRAQTRFGETEPPNIRHHFTNDSDTDADRATDADRDPEPSKGTDPATADQADTDEADTDEADTDEAEADEAEADEAEADEAEADEGSGPAPPAANARGDPLAPLGIPPPVEPAWLNWYGSITPETAQRLVCDSTIWRIILDPTTGQPLNVGRAPARPLLDPPRPLRAGPRMPLARMHYAGAVDRRASSARVARRRHYPRRGHAPPVPLPPRPAPRRRLAHSPRPHNRTRHRHPTRRHTPRPRILETLDHTHHPERHSRRFVVVSVTTTRTRDSTDVAAGSRRMLDALQVADTG